uniref:Uncharacterized protein n=1 Tax=Glycine max TaxID=3847 RepID=C6TMY5_SOYBN|nr:unknown [Glycine max]
MVMTNYSGRFPRGWRLLSGGHRKRGLSLLVWLVCGGNSGTFGGSNMISNLLSQVTGLCEVFIASENLWRQDLGSLPAVAGHVCA